MSYSLVLFKSRLFSEEKDEKVTTYFGLVPKLLYLAVLEVLFSNL